MAPSGEQTGERRGQEQSCRSKKQKDEGYLLMPVTDPPKIVKFSKYRNLSDFIRDLLSGAAGVTAVEYVVIICFTAAMAIISWGYLGGNLQTLFTNVGCYLTGSANCSTG